MGYMVYGFYGYMTIWSMGYWGLYAMSLKFRVF